MYRTSTQALLIWKFYDACILEMHFGNFNFKYSFINIEKHTSALRNLPGLLQPVGLVLFKVNSGF